MDWIPDAPHKLEIEARAREREVGVTLIQQVFPLTCPAGEPRAARGPLVVLPVAVLSRFFSLAHLLPIAPRRRRCRLAERRAWNKLLNRITISLRPCSFRPSCPRFSRATTATTV